MKPTFAGAAALVLGCACPVAAQTVDQAQDVGQEQPESAYQAGDVVVTAQRRETRLIDVPASISVIGPDTLEQQGITDFNDLAFKTPNVQIFENGNLAGRTSVTIRGVPGRAGIFIDDVFVGDSSGINGLLVDVERVEVLRGPQSTLFGRNAVSGAINTITRRPGDEVYAQSTLRYGNYNAAYVGAAVGVPIGPLLSASLSGAFKRSDGFDRERGAGRVNGDDAWAAQGKLRLRPRDGVDLLIAANYQRDDVKSGFNDAFVDYSINGAPGDVFRNARRDGDPYDRVVPTRNRSVGERREAFGFSGYADIEFGGVTLSSITAYREIDYLFSKDGDNSEFDLISGTQPVNYRQFSQEVRLRSATGGTIEWLVGAYYFNDRRRSSDFNLLGQDFILPGGIVPALAPLLPPLVPGGTAGVITIGRLFASPTLQQIVGLRPPAPTLGTQLTRDSNRISSLAAFGSVTARPIDRLELTAGLRYTRERVRASYARDTTGLLTAFVPSITEQFLDSGWDDDWSPTVSAAFKVTPQLSVYATYSKGFQSGGFNLAPAAVNPPPTDAADRRFRPETVSNYEVGAKGNIIDGRLYASVALFRMDYRDFQRSFATINPVTGAQFSTFNAEASMKGLEFEFVARPSRSLTVTAAYGLQDSQYDDYRNAPVNSYTVQGPNGVILIDLTGGPLPFVPRHGVSTAIEWTRSVGRLGLRLGADAQLRSDYKVTDGVDQIRFVDSVVQLGAHIGIGAPDGSWSLLGRAYNLTNQVFRTGLDYNNFAGTVYQSLSAPRTWAVEASIRF